MKIINRNTIKIGELIKMKHYNSGRKINFKLIRILNKPIIHPESNKELTLQIGYINTENMSKYNKYITVELWLGIETMNPKTNYYIVKK